MWHVDDVQFSYGIAGGPRLTGVVTYVAGVIGDYNGNGIVDAADYVLWRKNPATFGGNPSGYNTWRAHFGQTAGSGAGATLNGAVPEPATLVLLMIVASGWCLRRGRLA